VCPATHITGHLLPVLFTFIIALLLYVGFTRLASRCLLLRGSFHLRLFPRDVDSDSGAFELLTRQLHGLLDVASVRQLHETEPTSQRPTSSQQCVTACLSLQHLLSNPNVLVATSKGMRAVKLCSNALQHILLYDFFPASTAVLQKYLNDKLKLCFLQFLRTEFPEFSMFREIPEYSRFSRSVATL